VWNLIYLVTNPLLPNVPIHRQQGSEGVRCSFYKRSETVRPANAVRSFIKLDLTGSFIKFDRSSSLTGLDGTVHLDEVTGSDLLVGGNWYMMAQRDGA
jgi:hypothetical protein